MLETATLIIVYGRLMAAFFALVVGGFFIKIIARRLRGGSAPRAEAQPGRKRAGIVQKLNAFVGFQVLILSLSFWYYPGLAVFLLLLLGVSVYEIVALKPSRPAHAYGLLLLFAVSVAAYLSLTPGQGSPFLAFLFLLVATFDGYSQIWGEILGGPKIVPRISPGKTWSGFFGGLVFCAAASLAAQSFIFRFVSPGAALAVGLGTGALAFLGDISASWVKRRLGIKDFSELLGPQGGVLDRADSLLWLGPAAWALHTLR